MSISSKIQSLITAANSVTGESRTDLTSAVQDLKDGYGGGGVDGNRLEYIGKAPSTVYVAGDGVWCDPSIQTYSTYIYKVNPATTTGRNNLYLWEKQRASNRNRIAFCNTNPLDVPLPSSAQKLINAQVTTGPGDSNSATIFASNYFTSTWMTANYLTVTLSNQTADEPPFKQFYLLQED